MNIEIIENTHKQAEKKQPVVNLEPIFQREFNGGPVRRTGYKLAVWAMACFAVDALIVLFLTLTFILMSTILTQTLFPKDTISFITKQNLYDVLIVACVGLGWAYYLFMRLYFNATIGEMSCSIRVGKPSERVNAIYLLRVLLRLSLITFTGFIVLPLLSIIFKTDLSGKITKLSLYSLK